MRLEQVEYVVAVIRHGSFTRAAEDLHISQPALSESVRNFERELGVQLIDRKRGGTVVSDAGRELLPRLLSVLDSGDELRRACDEHHRGRRVIRLGTVTTATAPLLAPVLRGFRASRPATHIEIVTAKQELIDGALLDGSMDLALVNLLDGKRPAADLEAVELLRGRPVACVHSSSSLAAEPTVSAEALASEPLIAMRSGYAMHEYLSGLFGLHELAPAYSADGAEMAKQMVAGGLGVTVLPEFSVAGDPLERCGQLTYRPIAGERTEVRLMLERRRNVAMAESVAALRELFIGAARALGGPAALAVA